MNFQLFYYYVLLKRTKKNASSWSVFQLNNVFLRDKCEKNKCRNIRLMRIGLWPLKKNMIRPERMQIPLLVDDDVEIY